MKTHTTGRWMALAAAVLGVIGALAILCQDAIFSGTWTLQHGLIPVIMAIQILTAHSFLTACRLRRFLSAAGFLIVASAGTWGLLYTSVGKQSEVAATSDAAAEDVNNRRADLLKRLAANQDMLDGARQKLADECGTGKGRKCEGKAATVKVYDDAVKGVIADLEKIGPAKPVAPRAEKMAELIAALRGADKDHVKRVLVLIEPFTYAMICELAALVGFGFFFGHRPALVPNAPAAAAEPSARDSAQTGLPYVPGAALPDLAGPPDDPDQPDGPGGVTSPNGPAPKAPKDSPRLVVHTNRSNRKGEVLAALLTDQALGRSYSSQREAAERFNLPASTFSDWLKEWERDGVLPARKSIGRCKVLA